MRSALQFFTILTIVWGGLAQTELDLSKLPGCSSECVSCPGGIVKCSDGKASNVVLDYNCLKGCPDGES